ncbi:MAG: STN domain-containing protein, partial [Planctomycetales bacterium]|nr:STN domain-containing protein [Planctomycetales bacterium]
MRQVASWGLCFGWLCVSATFFASSGLAQEADNSPTSSAKSPKVGVVEKALDAKVSFEFIDTPLNDVVAYIADAQDINVLIDELALSDEGIAKDHPVTLGIRDVSLRSALRLMFKPLALTFVIEDEFLVITTPTTAETNLPVHVYPVQDLVGVRAADGDAAYYDTQQLIDLIEQTIAMDSWASVGGPGEARGAQGKLVV